MHPQEGLHHIVDDYVPLKSIEARTGLSKVSLCRFIHDGLLPGVPLPRARQTNPGGHRQWLVPEPSADAFVQAHGLAEHWGIPLASLLRSLRQGSFPQELAPLRPLLFPSELAEKITA